MGPIYRHFDFAVRYLGIELRQDHLLFINGQILNSTSSSLMLAFKHLFAGIGLSLSLLNSGAVFAQSQKTFPLDELIFNTLDLGNVDVKHIDRFGPP